MSWSIKSIDELINQLIVKTIGQLRNQEIEQSGSAECIPDILLCPYYEAMRIKGRCRTRPRQRRASLVQRGRCWPRKACLQDSTRDLRHFSSSRSRTALPNSLCRMVHRRPSTIAVCTFLSHCQRARTEEALSCWAAGALCYMVGGIAAGQFENFDKMLPMLGDDTAVQQQFHHNNRQQSIICSIDQSIHRFWYLF